METNELPEGQKDIFKFLLGESDYNGLWYGDPHPTEHGAFWWRKHLRYTIQQRDEEKRALVDYYDKLLAERDKFETVQTIASLTFEVKQLRKALREIDQVIFDAITKASPLLSQLTDEH